MQFLSSFVPIITGEIERSAADEVNQLSSFREGVVANRENAIDSVFKLYH